MQSECLDHYLNLFCNVYFFSSSLALPVIDLLNIFIHMLDESCPSPGYLSNSSQTCPDSGTGCPIKMANPVRIDSEPRWPKFLDLSSWPFLWDPSEGCNVILVCCQTMISIRNSIGTDNIFSIFVLPVSLPTSQPFPLNYSRNHNEGSQ